MRRTWLPVIVGGALASGVAIGHRLWPAGPPAAASPYVGQLASPVRGLTAQEVEDLRAGRGAGFARMAELNSYPGPRHAIDLADGIGLDSLQRQQAERIYARMRDEARQLGADILTREQSLSQAFAGRRIDPQDLVRATAELGGLYGRLRAVHLQAHVELTALLTPDQIRRYDQLRGYHEGASHQHGT